MPANSPRLNGRKERNNAKAGIEKNVLLTINYQPSSKIRPVEPTKKETPDGKTSMSSRRGIKVEIKDTSDDREVSKQLFQIYSPEKVDENDENSSPQNYSTRRQRTNDDENSENISKCLFNEFEEQFETKSITLTKNIECHSGKRYPTQKQVAGNQSASEYLARCYNSQKIDKSNSRWINFINNPNTKFEWLHLIAFSLFPKTLGSPQTFGNLGAGTYEANTEMIIWEQLSSFLSHYYEVQVTAQFKYFKDHESKDTKIIDTINYRVGVKYKNFIISLIFNFKDFDNNTVTGKAVDFDIACILLKYAIHQIDNIHSVNSLKA